MVHLSSLLNLQSIFTAANYNLNSLEMKEINFIFFLFFLARSTSQNGKHRQLKQIEVLISFFNFNILRQKNVAINKLNLFLYINMYFSIFVLF